MPSSWNWTNLAPPEATGKPRTEILALPSPPEASDRMPGIKRIRSAADCGAIWPMVSALTLLTEMLVSILRSGRAVPVTMISSCCAPVSTVAVGPVTTVGAVACAARGDAKIAVEARKSARVLIISSSPNWPLIGSRNQLTAARKRLQQKFAIVCDDRMVTV